MSATQIKGKPKGEIDCKRFYLPGLRIESECPGCKTAVVWDGDYNYLGNPVANHLNKFHMYCEECDEEWDELLILAIEVKEKK